LAIALLGGCRYGWGIFVGSLLAHGLTTQQPWLSVGLATAQTAGLLLACRLLKRNRRFDPRLQTMGHYLRLLLGGILPFTVVDGLIATPCLALAGLLPLDAGPGSFLLWTMGEALGTLLITPLILVWHLHPLRRTAKRRWPEAVLVQGVIVLMGLLIFQDYFVNVWSRRAHQAYWLFLPMAWAATRLGRRSVLLGLNMLAVLVLVGIHRNTGIFASP
ncbi:MASE1 domain-containing protein, partial [Leptospira sp. SA-E8]|uniref:MASE1 domain-containing protein n=1 Tax=Leptospira sp. SA-E8 TaxID=3422259 RepID=UPI003EB7AF94